MSLLTEYLPYTLIATCLAASLLTNLGLYVYRTRRAKARLVARLERNIELALASGATGVFPNYYNLTAGKWYWMRCRAAAQPVLILEAVDASFKFFTVRRMPSGDPYGVVMDIDDDDERLDDLEFVEIASPEATRYDEKLVEDLLESANLDFGAEEEYPDGFEK